MSDFTPLKVAHVVLSLDVGGLERNVVNQARLAREMGQELSVLCIEKPGVLASRAQGYGARVICIDKRPGIRPGIFRPIRAALRELAPHVIHTHQIGPLFYTGLAAMGLGAPLIVHTEHGKQNYAGRRRTRWLGRIAGRFTSAFYCLSQDMADSVAASRIVPARKLRVILNGIDTAAYRRRGAGADIRSTLGIPSDAPIVGTIGRLNEIKRQDVLLNAFAILRRTVPNAHLMLVGDGPLMQSLRDQAHQLEVDDSVHFVGYQSDTTPYLHAMDVFTLTSRSEGTPQSLLEACVAEIPVIASRVGGIPEVVVDGESGLLFETGDSAALADGLASLILDRRRALELSRNASRNVTARYDIRRMMADYHRDFLNLLNANRAVRESSCVA